MSLPLRKSLVLPVYYYDSENLEKNIVEKVSTNGPNIFEAYNELQNMKRIVSFYGDRDQIEHIMSEILKENIELSLKQVNEEYRAVMYIVLDYVKKTAYALLVCKSQELFDTKPLNKESLIISMQRYLQDFSSHVFIAPSKNTVENWSTDSKLSPFNYKPNTFFEFRSRSNDITNLRMEKIDVNFKKVEEYLNGEFFNFEDNNYSNNFYSVSFVNQSDIEEKKFKEFQNSISNQIIKISENQIDMFSQILLFHNKMDLTFDGEQYKTLESILNHFHQKVNEIKENFRENLQNKLVKDIKEINSQSNVSTVINEIITQPNAGHFAGLQSQSLKSTYKDFLNRSIMHHIDKIFKYENDILISDENNAKNIFEEFMDSLMDEVEKIEEKDDKIKFQKEDFINLFVYTISNKKREYLNETNCHLIEPIKDQFRFFQEKMELLSRSYNEKKNASDYFEVRRFTANFVLSDDTAININYANKFCILCENVKSHLRKSIAEKSSIQNLELFGIYPTKNINNSILIFKYDDKYKTNFSIFLYYHTPQKLKELKRYDQSFFFKKKNFYFSYSLAEEILLVLSFEKNSISLNKVDSNGMYNEIQTYLLNKNIITLFGQITSMIYIPFTELILLISNGKLYELKIEQYHKRTMKINDITLFQNDKNKTSYKDYTKAKLLYSGNGRFFAINFDNKIRFFDVNYDCCSLVLSSDIDCLTKICSSHSNIYILYYYHKDKKFQSAILPNCCNDFCYEEEESANKNNLNQAAYGNPILDYIYCGYDEFGPNMDFLNGFSKTKYLFLLPDKDIEDTKKSLILDYSKTVFEETISFEFEILLNDREQILKCTETIEYDFEKMKTLAKIFISRVPIQICTIENNNIIPMIDGKRTVMNNVFEKMSKIEDKAKYVSFGYIEKLICEIKGVIFLCCVIGRQSTGKSYLMNRIFGTRFSVASTRCTDGIWMSYSCINGNHIIVFDCEGIFSKQRKEIEEIKMMTLLTALCNFTYLNQDLSFSRDLNSLLNNLSQSIGRLEGDNLFKGKLVWTIRNVSDQMRDGAKKEFERNLTLFKNNEMKYLNKLFKDNIALMCLNSYDHKSFKKEIDKCRNLALEKITDIRKNLSKNVAIWTDGHQLLTSLKIILIQLYADDDSLLDEVTTNFLCNELREHLKDVWQHIDKIKDLNLENTVNLFELNVGDESSTKKISFQYSIFDITLCYDENSEYFKRDFLETFFKDRAKENSIEYEDKQLHNVFYEAFNKFMEHFAKQRRQVMMAYAEKEVENRAIPKDKSKAFLLEIDDYLLSTLQKLVICLNVCSKSFLLCSKQSRD